MFYKNFLEHKFNDRKNILKNRLHSVITQILMFI